MVRIQNELRITKQQAVTLRASDGCVSLTFPTNGGRVRTAALEVSPQIWQTPCGDKEESRAAI